MAEGTKRSFVDTEARTAAVWANAGTDTSADYGYGAGHSSELRREKGRVVGMWREYICERCDFVTTIPRQIWEHVATEHDPYFVFNGSAPTEIAATI